MKQKQQKQTYNDGLAMVCEKANIAEPGCMPKEGLAVRLKLRFDERTVGINRFYAATQANVQIDRVIRCQRREDVSTQDTVQINGQSYEIKQIQYPKDVVPKSMDLSLKKVVQKYESK